MNKFIAFAVVCAALFLVAQNNRVRAGDTSDDLFAAIKSGDAAKVEAMLVAGADPNTRIQAGITALIAAAFAGNAEIAKLLLDKGADINVKSDNGITALMMAATKGHKEVVQLLLDKGADANIREAQGFNAFQMALAEKHDEVATLLRGRTKGAANWRIGTVVGPLEGKQKCLPVTKSADEASQKVACLKAGVEVSTAGESGDQRWALLRKPLSGWVPENKLKRGLMRRMAVRHPAPRSSPGRAASSSRDESGINPADLPSMPSSRGGAWWQR